MPADFSVSVQPSSPVGCQQRHDDVHRGFRSQQRRTRTATLLIVNDDPNENPYNFTIQGIGFSTDFGDAPALSVTLAEDGARMASPARALSATATRRMMVRIRPVPMPTTRPGYPMTETA